MDSNYTVIVLPGIGGHPEFHTDLLQQFSKINCVTIKSFVHGDFYTSSFTSLTQHIDYWSMIINNEFAENKKVGLIAISYGTAIVQSLPKEIIQRISFVCLLSPINNTRIIRLTLKMLSIFDNKLTSKLFGKFLFWWSIQTSKDKKRLIHLRKSIYDDLQKVYHRLWKRLLSIKESNNFNTFATNAKGNPLMVLFGKNELLKYFFLKERKKALNQYDYIEINGNHSQLINDSEEISHCIENFINKLYG